MLCGSCASLGGGLEGGLNFRLEQVQDNESIHGDPEHAPYQSKHVEMGEGPKYPQQLEDSADRIQNDAHDARPSLELP